MKELDIELWEVNYSNVFLTFPFKKEEPLLYRVREHLMIYSYDGEMEICQDKTVVTIHPGECVFARKNHKIRIVRKSENEESFCVLFFVFDRSFLRKYFNDVCKSQIDKKLKDSDSNKLIFLKPSLHIDSFFQSMIPYLNSAAQPSKEIIGFKLHEAIHFLLNEDIRVAASLFDFIEPWKVDLQDFMDENYMYDLSSSEIASFTGRSLATFKRDFQKISEFSPQKWIIHKRLEEARKLMLEEGKKVSDIYLEVGFKSLSHFSQAYKKQYGKAPTQ